jgi:chemotaxis protein histidine kinase CheA
VVAPAPIDWARRRDDFERQQLAFRDVRGTAARHDTPSWVVVDGLGAPVTALQLATRTRDEDTLSRIDRERRTAQTTSKVLLITGLSTVALSTVPLMMMEEGDSKGNRDLAFTSVFVAISGGSLAAISPLRRTVQARRHRQPAYLYSRPEAEARVGQHNRSLFERLQLSEAPPEPEPEPEPEPTPEEAEAEAERAAELQAEGDPPGEGVEDTGESTEAPSAERAVPAADPAGEDAMDEAAEDEDLPEAGPSAPEEPAPEGTAPEETAPGDSTAASGTTDPSTAPPSAASDAPSPPDGAPGPAAPPDPVPPGPAPEPAGGEQ